MTRTSMVSRAVEMSCGAVVLHADLCVPAMALGIVVFAHGSGSSRHSPRNKAVAAVLNQHGFATLLADLLTRTEEVVDGATAEHRFNISLLAKRLEYATSWLRTQEEIKQLAVGYFGASTGAAAALVAVSRLKQGIFAVVSRGGRPDLAGASLPLVTAPTLLIVGGDDRQVLELNRKAMAMMRCEKALDVIPGASHLFEERGALEKVASLAVEWFTKYAPQMPHRSKKNIL